MQKLVGLVITPDLARGIGLALDAMSDTCDFVEELSNEGRMDDVRVSGLPARVRSGLWAADSAASRAYQAITEEVDKLDSERDRKFGQRKCASCESYAPCWCEY